MKFMLHLFAGCFAFSSVQAIPVTFEPLPLGNPGTDGSTPYGSTGTYYWNGSDTSGAFSSENVTFQNSFTDFGTFTAWNGFAYSNTTDTSTAGFGNQYSAAPGSGANGSGQYAIGFPNPGSVLNFASALDFSGGKGAYLTNTTYAALDMQNGSAFTKKFGGVDGTDPDWFLLTIDGSLGGSGSGSVAFYLADFRSSNPSEDYIHTDWAFADLSSLGTVDQLTFSLSSSDTGSFGMNTPGYFALDNLGVIPEPGTLLSALLAAVLLMLYHRRSARS